MLGQKPRMARGLRGGDLDITTYWTCDCAVLFLTDSTDFTDAARWRADDDGANARRLRREGDAIAVEWRCDCGVMTT